MSDNVAVVDTNVLVYALYQQSDHHATATALLNRTQDGENSLFSIQPGGHGSAVGG